MRFTPDFGRSRGRGRICGMAACERKEEDGGSEWRQSMHNVCAFAIRYKVSIQS